MHTAKMNGIQIPELIFAFDHKYQKIYLLQK